MEPYELERQAMGRAVNGSRKFRIFLCFRRSKYSTILFSERDGRPFSSIVAVNALTVLYGPKGGWSDEELELARAKGANVITLGGRILRAETAAIAITAIIQHRFGDMN